MMNNNKNMNGQFDRMKQLMSYGLNESKKQPYAGVEYHKVAADGKLYGIVREGTKFYIKVSSNKDNVLAENFEYIGGFRNRKDNEYSSFASAQKNFDFKLRSLAEAYGNGKDIVVESWNPDRQEELTVEATNKMKKEISRERQIMENAMKIFNRKPQTAIKPINEVNECGSNPFCINPDKEFKDAQKSNIKGEVEEGGDAEKANKGYKKATTKGSKIVGEASEKPLGWNREDPDYMDKTHGTEIGDKMPFDGPEARNIDDGDKKVTKTGEEKQGTIHEEDTSMIYTPDNQNSPKPGVGEIGDDNPFDDGEGRQIDEAIDDIDGDADLEDGADGDADLDLGGEEGDDFEGEDDGFEGEDDDLDLGGEDAVGGDLESRMDAIEAKLDQLLDAVAEEDYEDDDLYDDEEGEDDGTDFDLEMDDAEDDGLDAEGDDFEGDGDFEDEEPIEDETVFESRAYRAMRLREAARGKMPFAKANQKSPRGKMPFAKTEKQEPKGKMPFAESRLTEGGLYPFKDAGRVPSGNMNKLDDFGKHPAYQKVVMDLPPKDLQEFPGYYDMNDDSVRNDAPYGEKIGDGAPFDVDPESIDNAIAESIQRILKKKK